MEDKVIEKMEESIKTLLSQGLTTANVDNLLKLSKIKHMAKEDKNMNYNERGPGYDTYGDYYRNYRGYGEDYRARGRDMRYRGDDAIDRMSGEYGRYQESRSRYGAGEETDRSYHYMVKALEDFIKVLYEEADTEPQRQMLRETLQRSMK